MRVGRRGIALWLLAAIVILGAAAAVVSYSSSSQAGCSSDGKCSGTPGGC
jgi:hypothetical protein